MVGPVEGEEGPGEGGPGEGGNAAPKEWAMPPAVDLGLPSGKGWAAFDLGAGTIAEYGNYFSWGELEPKAVEEFVWSGYAYAKGSEKTLTKYCHDPNFGCEGYKDELSLLEAGDDAATARLNEDWRIPTSADYY